MEKSKFQFKTPVIKKLSLTSHPNWDKNTDREISLSINTNINTPNNSDKEMISETAIVSVSLTIGDTDEISSPFYMQIELISQFKWKDIKDVKPFLKYNASALLISYARPIVALLTSQLGLPAYHLPFINFAE